jgi:hypothetical protein
VLGNPRREPGQDRIAAGNGLAVISAIISDIITVNSASTENSRKAISTPKKRPGDRV